MSRRLPGLGAMRTFEAAARHLSFSRAAEELGVTPAAVSHLVRELEDQLRLKLFERTTRAVRPTRAGEILAEAVDEALDGIGRAVARLSDAEGRPHLTVSAAPSFAAKWLVPRLDRFLSRAPDVEVRVDVSPRLVDLAREDVDVGIRYGTGNYPGLEVDRLFGETVVPVCSPALMRGPRPLRHPRDLRHHTLVHVDWQARGEIWPTWQMWLLAMGVSDIDTSGGIHFDLGSLAIQAAIDGQGVALGDGSLIAPDLAAGRLVKPFDLSLEAGRRFAYFLVTAPQALERPLVATFRTWVLEEVAAMEKPALQPGPAAVGRGRKRRANAPATRSRR